MSDTPCRRCGFLSEHCLCTDWPELSWPHRFCLLIHQREFGKPSNTGKLVKAMLPETLVLDWSRVEPPAELPGLLQGGNYQPMLLMPEEYAIYHRSHQASIADDKPKLFILLDATWQQARKMYRQSPYLHDLPLMGLADVPESRYELRRNQKNGHLCTAEVAAEIMKHSGFTQGAFSVHQAVSRFCSHYLTLRQMGKIR